MYLCHFITNLKMDTEKYSDALSNNIFRSQNQLKLMRLDCIHNACIFQTAYKKNLWFKKYLSYDTAVIQ